MHWLLRKNQQRQNKNHNRRSIDNPGVLFIQHNPPRYIINKKVKWSASHSLSIILLSNLESSPLESQAIIFSSREELQRRRRPPLPESHRLAGPREERNKSEDSRIDKRGYGDSVMILNSLSARRTEMCQNAKRKKLRDVRNVFHWNGRKQRRRL